MNKRSFSSHNMNVDFKTRATHSNRVSNSCRIIYFEFLWNHMNHFTIRWDKNSFSCFNHAINIVLCNFFSFNRNNSRRVKTIDMISCNSYCGRLKILKSGHKFCFINRCFDRLNSFFNINN